MLLAINFTRSCNYVATAVNRWNIVLSNESHLPSHPLQRLWPTLLGPWHAERAKSGLHYESAGSGLYKPAHNPVWSLPSTCLTAAKGSGITAYSSPKAAQGACRVSHLGAKSSHQRSVPLEQHTYLIGYW